MTELDWYFDFISPYAYFQLTHFNEFPDNIKFNLKPVLFAGLLKHWENKGPAEIPAKRKLMYRHTLWQARKNKIPFRMPPAHPFNPLKALRLSIVLDNDKFAVGEIFDFIWVQGHSLEDLSAWDNLTKKLDVENADEKIKDPVVKEQLHTNTQKAIELGVFGVPTTIFNGELFWGFDTTEMLLEYITNSELFEDAEMNRVSNLPESVQRKIMK
jgi:2-hydroxychromene-2-carboxylate isomerase